jgi:predicted N-formylglutamate amidohydrolase
MFKACPALRDRSGGKVIISAPAFVPLLGPDDPPPVGVERPGADSPFLFVCDHAGAAIPRRLARLGLDDDALASHIAWDPGALDLARSLAEILDSTLIRQAYSRLVIDCNRHPDHPASILAVSDGVAVPGNLQLAPGEGAARRSAIFDPYHARIGAELDARAGRGIPTLLVCVHSFTPVMAGVRRPWHIGVLHGGQSPASEALLALLRSDSVLTIGDNEPYAMDGTDFTAPHHAWERGLDVVELEIRHDLLREPAGVAEMAGVVARGLRNACDIVGQKVAEKG